MTSDFALTYIPRRMRELKVGPHYFLRYRHLVLRPSAVKKINSGTDFYFLLQPVASVRVESEAGTYDRTVTNINEMQYEHRGRIVIKNLSAAEVQHVHFIQVIPKNTKEKK